MDENELNTYDFIINDEGEVMLLLHAQETEPKNARIEVDVQEKSAVLIRNPDDEILLQDLPDDVIDNMQDEDTILVCELKIGEKEEDTQIVNAYEAEICD